MKVRWIVMIAVLSAVAVIAPAVCFAGLGDPVPAGKAEWEKDSDGEALTHARSLLRQKGYDDGRIDAALAKLGRERVAMIERDAAQARAGGFLLDLLLFVLFVALIVWLIIVVVESAERGYYSRPRYRY